MAIRIALKNSIAKITIASPLQSLMGLIVHFFLNKKPFTPSLCCVDVLSYAATAMAHLGWSRRPIAGRGSGFFGTDGNAADGLKPGAIGITSSSTTIEQLCGRNTLRPLYIMCMMLPETSPSCLTIFMSDERLKGRIFSKEWGILSYLCCIFAYG